jgi:exo-1,4-beta-D-glucosaminidase
VTDPNLAARVSGMLRFQVHLGIRRSGSAEEILPVLWDDNYFILIPGESNTITARYRGRTALREHAVVVVDGWNIVARTLAIKE